MATDGRAVRLVRSGGFAGLKMSATKTVDDLPEAAQVALEAAPPAARAKATGGADRFQYELTIPTGPKRTRTYRFAEGSTPDGLESVVSALADQLKPGD
jgi:hypothetical protein